VISIKNSLGNVDWGDNYTDMYTIWYRPPEIACQKRTSYGKYDDKADIWALGCTLYEYICRKPLIKGNSISSYLRIIRKLVGDTNEEYEAYNTNTINVKHEIDIKDLFQKILGEIYCSVIPQPYITLLSKMLKIDPKERISVEEALMDPIVLPYGGIKNSEFNILKQSYPLSSYLYTTTTIDPEHKHEMLKWLMELSYIYGCKISTYIMAIDIFDRYSSKNVDKITHDNIKLHLVVCLGLAYKYNEQNKFCVNYINEILDYKCENFGYIEVELDIFKSIEYNIYNSELCVVLRALKFKKKLYEIFDEILPAYYTMVKETTYPQIAKKIIQELKK